MIATPPMLTGSPIEQVAQMRTYLFQLAEMLNVALTETNVKVMAVEERSQQSASEIKDEADNSYKALRDLIIKTGDTVTLVRDEIDQTLRSSYVTKSDYGDYYEQIETNVKQTAESVLTSYNYDAQISDVLERVDGLDNWTAHVEGYIRQGIIGEDENGLPIIGIAIGQNLRSLGKQTVDGVSYDVLDNKQSCAFYTSTGISFRLGGKEVAYLTNEREFITDLVVGGTLTLGEWQISDSNGFTIKWIGG